MHELVVVGGVSGSGKSTIGALLAQRLDVPFIDADSLHPEANVTKMAAGLPLTDIDRAPWLVRIGEVLSEHDASGLVLACSALKRRYRDTIRDTRPPTSCVRSCAWATSSSRATSRKRPPDPGS
jgi:gluconokinase